MHITHHCKARQSQRGISLKMVDFVLNQGALEQDNLSLGSRRPDSVWLI